MIRPGPLCRLIAPRCSSPGKWKWWSRSCRYIALRLRNYLPLGVTRAPCSSTVYSAFETGPGSTARETTHNKMDGINSQANVSSNTSSSLNKKKNYKTGSFLMSVSIRLDKTNLAVVICSVTWYLNLSAVMQTSFEFLKNKTTRT